MIIYMNYIVGSAIKKIYMLIIASYSHSHKVFLRTSAAAVQLAYNLTCAQINF